MLLAVSKVSRGNFPLDRINIGSLYLDMTNSLITSPFMSLGPKMQLLLWIPRNGLFGIFPDPKWRDDR